MTVYSGTRELPEVPGGDLRLRRGMTIRESLRELWDDRALVRTLAERDLRVRYKQAFLGFAWSLLLPLALLGAFTLLFDHAAHVPHEGVPYPLFALMGVVPWTFFTSSVTNGGQSIVVDKLLLNKVHFPREIFPLGDTLVAAFDALMATVVLGTMFGVETFAPKATSVWVPLLLLIMAAFTIGITLFVSSLLVYLRDLRIALPIMLQLGLFLTPVAYSLDAVPKNLRIPYSILNPLAPVIDGLRRCVLEGLAPRGSLLLAGGLSSVVVLVAGYRAFKRLELGFADVA